VDPEFQARQFVDSGASEGEVEELLRYNENVFSPDSATSDGGVPLPDEPFVDCWQGWAAEADRRGAFAVLAEHLPQLRFPIREGISRSDGYRAAVLRGVPVADLPEAAGLGLERPEVLELELYRSFAGRIPLLIVRGRREFVTLVRALAKKNEPAPISEAQGATMVAGFPNWHRIRELRRAWEAADPATRGTATWAEEFARIRQHRELYQDRFVILSDGPYSAVDASDLGLSDRRWRELSLIIRREHECTHYYTRRVFDSMRNHLLDELIADYTGLVAALGRYRADWFLRFLGLEDYPRYRAGARLDLYRGDPPLSSRAFAVLQTLVRKAARNLERFDANAWPDGARRSMEERAAMVRALATLTLTDLAAPEAQGILDRALDRARGTV